MPIIQLKDFNLGGIAYSDYQGPANSLAEINGIDLHAEGGIMQAYQDFKNITFDETPIAGGLIRELNSNIYQFSNNRIYKYSSAYNTFFYTRGLNGVRPTDSLEFGTYTYFTDNNRSVWRVLTDNIETATVQMFINNTLDSYNSDYGRVMFKKNNRLFIANKNKVASIDLDGTIILDDLDIEEEFNITAIDEFQNDLVIATSNGVYSKIYRWDTYEVSWINVAIIEERKISAFLKDGGGLLAFTEGIGNIYFYNGVSAQWLKSLKGDWSQNASIKIKPHAVTKYNRDILFGISQGVSSSPDIPKGVYSYSRTGPDYPRVMSLLKEVEGSVTYDIQHTTQGLFVSLDDKAYLIDATSKLETASYATRVIDVNRNNLKDFSLYVNYKKFPEVCVLQLFERRNGETVWSEVSLTQNEKYSRFETSVKLLETNTIQFKIVHTSSGNDTPEVESLIIDY